jgi:hypothetical protein
MSWCSAALLLLTLPTARIVGEEVEAPTQEVALTVEVEAMPEGEEAKAEEPEDPEMAALEKEDEALEEQSAALADKFRAEQDQQLREKIKEKLQKIVNDHFDLRQRKRALEIERLEQQLEELRHVVQRRDELRQTIIDRRLDELINEEDLSF